MTPKWSVVDGIQTLWEKVAGDLKDVRLNVNISKISRGRFFNTIKFKLTDQTGFWGTRTRSITCGKIIIAFPQIASKMSFLDMDNEELAIFSRVKTEQYFSSAVFTPGFANPSKRYLGYARASPMNDGHLKRAEKPYGIGEPQLIFSQNFLFSTIYSWASEGIRAPIDVVKSLILKDTAGLSGLTLNQDSIKDFNVWDYFPHFGTNDIVNGIYKKLDELQGHRDTYYIGSLFLFESVEATIQSTKDIFNRHFAKKSTEMAKFVE